VQRLIEESQIDVEADRKESQIDVEDDRGK